jgi:uncharacterized protein YrzB (UPF0473 family)
MNKLHFFIENGILKVIKDLPERPTGNFDEYDFEDYQSALKAAKRDAIEVDNKWDVVNALFNSKAGEWFENSRQFWHDMKEGEIYSLECEMELRTIQRHPNPDLWERVAFITFSEPKPMNEEKEVPIVWAQCLNCEARNHPQNTKCDECGSSSLENENLVNKPISPLPVEDKEEWKVMADSLYNALNKLLNDLAKDGTAIEGFTDGWKVCNEYMKFKLDKAM